MKKTIKINKNAEGKRLDIALIFEIKNFTRSYIKKHIEMNLVKVNGELEYRANRKVLEGDVVEIEILEEKNDSMKIKPENIDIDIVYEDEDLVAINKPAGMVVHPATGNWTGTVMNALLYHYRKLENIGEKVRSGLIHRLDKDTSGLLLIGKTNKGLWHYSKLFSERKVKKKYIACVKGDLPDGFFGIGKMEVKNYLARNKVSRKKMTVVGDVSSRFQLPPDARLSHTDFFLKDSNEMNHLLVAFPKTGRTHQIRVHTNHVGIPIIGDTVYGGMKNSRMLLHAYSLQINTPEGKRLEIKAKPDKEFVENIGKFGLDIKKIIS